MKKEKLLVNLLLNGRTDGLIPRAPVRAKKSMFNNIFYRRPIGAPSASSVTTQSTPDSLADDIQSIDLKNSFNINASVFVPVKASLSVAASEFVPGQFDSTEPGDKAELSAEDKMEGEEVKEEAVEQHPSVTLLYDAMYQLTLEPGRFDSIARQLTSDLNTVITDYETLESLAEIILENGINEPNFRYTGARLSDYLSLHLTVIIEGATLRQIIMQKCNREFKLREKMLKDDPEHLRGFILFLAELFQQLEIQVSMDYEQSIELSLMTNHAGRSCCAEGRCPR